MGGRGSAGGKRSVGINRNAGMTERAKDYKLRLMKSATSVYDYGEYTIANMGGGNWGVFAFKDIRMEKQPTYLISTDNSLRKAKKHLGKHKLKKLK